MNPSTTFLDRLPAWVKGPWFFALVAIAIYANTVGNEYALDDGLVLNENTYVKRGIPGIPDILTHDSFHGAIGNSAYLSGGRYRPLSLVTYAVEVSLFGMKPWVHHLGNVLLYAACCVVLFRFLHRFVFSGHPWAAWCVVLLFTVHPIHTEVVANIKGRDELLSLFFLILTLHHAMAHAQWNAQRGRVQLESRSKRKERGKSGQSDQGKRSAIWSVLCFVAALLSKENGLIFIGLLPLSLYFLGGLSIPDAIKRSLPVIALVVLYMAVRIILLGARNNTVTEVMDNPYLLASFGEKVASILYVMLTYVRMMFWPHPLVYDYSFAQIPLHDFGAPIVHVSLLLHLGLLAFAVSAFRRRDLIAWCILFYLATLFLVSNLFFNVGAPLAERFLFQASVPFLIGGVEGMRRLLSRADGSAVTAPAIAGSIGLIALVSCSAVVARNAEWKSGDDLFLTDVERSPNSVRTRTFAGIASIHLSDKAEQPHEKRALAWQALEHFHVADSIHPTYLPTLLNMGLAHYRLDSLDAAEACWDRVRALDPNDPKLKQLEDHMFDKYYKGGLKAGTNKDLVEAERQLRRSLKYAARNADAWYNLGGVQYTMGKYVEARASWQKTLELLPDHPQAQQGLRAMDAAGH